MASTTPSLLPPRLRHSKSQHSIIQAPSSIAQPRFASIGGFEEQQPLGS
jgi:hypothetical protein